MPSSKYNIEFRVRQPGRVVTTGLKTRKEAEKFVDMLHMHGISAYVEEVHSEKGSLGEYAGEDTSALPRWVR